jgi:hypothetical protein
MKEEIIRLLDECEKNLSDVDFKHLSSYIGLYLSVSRMYSNYLRVGFFDINLNSPTDISVYYHDYSGMLGGPRLDEINPDLHIELSREISPIHIDILKKLSSDISEFSYIMMRYSDNGFIFKLSSYFKDKSFQEVFDLVEEHFNAVYGVLNFIGELINQYSSLDSLDKYKKIISPIIEDQKKIFNYYIKSEYIGDNKEKLTEKVEEFYKKCLELSDSEFLDLPEPDYTEIKDLGLSLKLQYYLDNDGKQQCCFKSKKYISYLQSENNTVLLEKLENLQKINYQGLSEVSKKIIDVSIKLSSHENITRYFTGQDSLPPDDLNKIFNEVFDYLMELGFILHSIPYSGFSDISFKKLMKDLRTDLFKLSAIRRILEIDTHKYYPSLVSTFARKEIITKLLINKY